MTVKIYDEKNQLSCRVSLSNLVDTLDIPWVGLSLPMGTIRLNYSKAFTHLSFTAQGENWIVKVIKIVNLGDDLIDVYYDVDYLKDYWNKHNTRNCDFVIHRTSESSLWSKFVPDPLYAITNEPTYSITTGNTFTWNSVDYVVSMNLSSTYATPTLFRLTLGNASMLLGACTVSEKVRNLINKIYVVPSVFVSTIPQTEVSSQNVSVPYANWLGGQDKTTLASVCGGLWDDFKDPLKAIFTLNQLEVYPGSRTTNLSYVSFGTGITIPHNNWTDSELNKYTLQIPLVGYKTIDARKNYGTLTVKYVVDLFEGSVKAFINDDFTTITPSVSLPEIPIGEMTSNSSVLQGIQSAVLALTTAAASSNPQTAVPGLLMGLATTGKALYEDNMTSGSYSKSSGYDVLQYPQVKLSTTSYSGINTLTQHSVLYGYISDTYMQKMSSLQTSRYYWLDMSNAKFYGADWYIAGARQAYHNQRIFVV